MVVKFETDTNGAIWWPNLQLMRVTESISGSVVPLAMFYVLRVLPELTRMPEDVGRLKCFASCIY